MLAPIVVDDLVVGEDEGGRPADVERAPQAVGHLAHDAVVQVIAPGARLDDVRAVGARHRAEDAGDVGRGARARVQAPRDDGNGDARLTEVGERLEIRPGRLATFGEERPVEIDGEEPVAQLTPRRR